jgi:hypothetical protein
MSDGLPGLTAALADRYVIERELGQGGMAAISDRWPRAEQSNRGSPIINR